MNVCMYVCWYGCTVCMIDDGLVRRHRCSQSSETCTQNRTRASLCRIKIWCTCAARGTRQRRLPFGLAAAAFGWADGTRAKLRFTAKIRRFKIYLLNAKSNAENRVMREMQQK